MLSRHESHSHAFYGVQLLGLFMLLAFSLPVLHAGKRPTKLAWLG